MAEMSDERDESQEPEFSNNIEEEAAQENGPLREISDEEFNRILEEHQKWLESEEEEGTRADFSRLNLQDRNLKEINFERADFRGANLNDTNLSGANLQGANLSGAKLRRADLRNANIKLADLSHAELQGAALDKAHLFQAKLIVANLSNTNVENANLEQADLSKANLQSANLNRSDLSLANLRNTSCSSANFIETDLNGADLFNAHLEKADFRRANLSYANLNKALLFSANLEKTVLQSVSVKANVIDSNFHDSELHHADLSGAIILRTNFGGANLFKANLRGANIRETSFKNANLLNADLREANLQDSDLTGTIGLQGSQLAGANVSSTELPEPILKFEGLKTVEELSKNAKRIFQIMLLCCAYSWLTIAMTTDARLLTNSASSPLPIIQTAIPIAWFFMVAPIVLFSIYLYFHLYLQLLWAGLADLPAVFPDGKSVIEHASQWLLIGIARPHIKVLRGTSPIFSGLQSIISILLAWFVVPVTNFVFWVRYLPRHDWFVTIIHIALLIASVFFAALSYRFARSTIRLEEINRKGYGLITILVILWFGIVSFYSYGAISSSIPYPLFPPLEFRIRANFREADVSLKPDIWTGSEIELVRGANLKGRNLSHADAFRAFMVNADIRDANLEGADLTEADLRGANLLRTNLANASLSSAKLRGANLRDVNLTNADLQGANVDDADLQGADIQWANFSGVKNLNLYQVKVARNFKLALYDDNFLRNNGKQIGLPNSEKEHTKTVKEKLDELEKKEKSAGGK